MPPLQFHHAASIACFFIAVLLVIESSWGPARKLGDEKALVKNKVIKNKVMALFAVLMGAAIFAADYPLVTRSHGFFASAPYLFKLAFPLAIVESAGLFGYLKRKKHPRAYLAVPAFLAFWLLSEGHLQLLNGALDRSPPVRHRTRIMGTVTHPQRAKSAQKWEIVIVDWQKRSPQVFLWANRQQAQRAGMGGEIEVTTQAGALGEERMLGWRFMP